MKKAAGFILYRPSPEGHLYLSLRNAGHGDVGMPKGHCDAGEADLETAFRETLEETGIGRDTLRVNTAFSRTIEYAVESGPKSVTYFVAESATADVRLSREHESFDWRNLDDTREAIAHVDLRRVVRDAAVFSKDPLLRRGLNPPSACALLVQHVGATAPVVAHSAQVAAIARIMTEALGGLDADYVEAAAWVHDIGRARTHERRHTIEGFRLLEEDGYPGYAPPCVSHYTKGRTREEIGDEEFAEELFAACDLETFGDEERLIALADGLASRDKRVRLEARFAELRERYGPSPFLDRSLELGHGLLREFEERSGQPLYPLLGI